MRNWTRDEKGRLHLSPQEFDEFRTHFNLILEGYRGVGHFEGKQIWITRQGTAVHTWTKIRGFYKLVTTLVPPDREVTHYYPAQGQTHPSTRSDNW